MERDPDRHHDELNNDDLDNLELTESLRRLGIRELEERLELSPLLVDPGLENADRCECTCSCDDLPTPDNPPMPDHSGTGFYLGPR